MKPTKPILDLTLSINQLDSKYQQYQQLKQAYLQKQEQLTQNTYLIQRQKYINQQLNYKLKNVKEENQQLSYSLITKNRQLQYLYKSLQQNTIVSFPQTTIQSLQIRIRQIINRNFNKLRDQVLSNDDKQVVMFQ